MSNQSARPSMSLRPLAAAGEVELLVYGDIGENWWGGESVTAKSVVDQLAAQQADLIHVRVNSYGGSVADGIAIYNALRNHPAAVKVSVDGVAVSSASLIAMAGDEVVMPATAVMMIHAPWGAAQGNAVDMRDMAAVLDTYARAMAEAYAVKTGKPHADMLAMLSDGKDHWYTAREAVDAGFADSVAGEAVDGDAEDASPNGVARYLSSAPQRIAAALRVAPPQLETPNMTINAAASPADIQAQALAAMRDRNDRIHAALRDVMEHAGVRDLYETALRDPAMTLEAVQAKALALLGANASAANGGGGRVESGADSRDKFIAGVTNAVMARAGMEKIEAGNEYAGIRLHNIVRASLKRAGVGGVERLEASQLAEKVFASLGGSDFPLLIANTANKALRAAYDMAPQTWRDWCAVGEVSDFKANSRIQVGTFNSLAEIKPAGEYTYGSYGEEAESITAITKGKGLALTRQLIINDDLGAFVNAARMMGFAAQRTVNEDAYARLFAATAMADTGALFNSTAVTTLGGHANLAGSGGAISATTLASGRAAMALQKDKNLRTVLNLRPRFLLIPEGKLQVAYDVLKPYVAATGGSNFVTALNLTLVSDGQMDANSATAWFMVADANLAPLIEVDFLGGQQTPYVAEAVDWDTDAMKFKVRLDYGVQAIDWRAGYKNPGA